MKFVIGMLLTAITVYPAAEESGSCPVKSLAHLALLVILHENRFVPSEIAQHYIDLQLLFCLQAGEITVEAIPADFKCPIPLSNEYIAQKLLNTSRCPSKEYSFSIDRYKRRSMVKAAAYFFEILQTRPHIARVIESKQKEAL